MAKANLKRKVRKKRYKHAVINKKKYYFYKITWSDILGDSSHNSAEEFDKMKPAVMVTQAYVYKKTKNIFEAQSEQKDVQIDFIDYLQIHSYRT